ncbi:MAG: hypothetical protein L0H55_12775 [Candidatus Nitrosocosmicus sp.]|nr:hypothetical protein [Candidatus Nitrosocosmicus sp.]
MAQSNNKNNKNDDRGLASANKETRERVARTGGEAPHDERGLQAADEETRKRVALEGGKAYNSNFPILIPLLSILF